MVSDLCEGPSSPQVWAPLPKGSFSARVRLHALVPSCGRREGERDDDAVQETGLCSVSSGLVFSQDAKYAIPI